MSNNKSINNIASKELLKKRDIMEM